MSLIKNLITEPVKKTQKTKTNKNGEQVEVEENTPRPLIKSATDLQRLKLEKLMKNPEKLVVIPEQRREKDYLSSVPSFVRNVMGSSAGAGSGEFHVYRHLRRKEYARQKTIQAKSAREERDEEYQHKLEENRRIADEKTAKKRAKRLKKKQRAKKPRANKPTNDQVQNDNDTASDNSNATDAEDDEAQKNDELSDNKQKVDGELTNETGVGKQAEATAADEVDATVSADVETK